MQTHPIVPTASPGFLWNVDGLPVSVLFSPALLAELRANLSATPSGDGMEFGGILLGSVANDRDAFRTTVVAFEQFPIEHRHGPQYMLSPRDRHQLERRLKRRRRGGLVPVGLCRSHCRRGLYLDQRDFEVFQADFGQPSAVFLLLRPNETEPTGAVFVWEENDVRRHASYLEFPINPVAGPLGPDVVAPVAVATASLLETWSQRVNESARNLPVFPTWSTPAMAKVVVTVALPLLSFYAAREFAAHRPDAAVTAAPASPAPDPVSQPAPAADQPAPALQPAPVVPPPPTEAPDVKPSPVRALAGIPAVTPPSAVVADSRASRQRAALESRDRTAGSAASAAPAPNPQLPEPPDVQQQAMSSASIPQFSKMTIEPPTSAGQPPSKVVAFIKPAPRSGIRHALQKVPVLRDLAGHEQPGEGFVPANPVEHPLPATPAGKAASEKNGSIEMLAKVDRKGNVAVVKVVDGNHHLADASAHALLQWRFEPARQDGAAVDSEMLIRFEFRNPTR